MAQSFCITDGDLRARKMLNLPENEDLDDILGVEEREAEILSVVNVMLSEEDFKNKVQKGDIVQLFPTDSTYRNDGKFIFDGEKLIALDSTYDEYGAIPPQFQFPEFPFNHWDDVIDHNKIRWFQNEDEINAAGYGCNDDSEEFDYDNDWETFLCDKDGVEKRYVIYLV